MNKNIKRLLLTQDTGNWDLAYELLISTGETGRQARKIVQKVLEEEYTRISNKTYDGSNSLLGLNEYERLSSYIKEKFQRNLNVHHPFTWVIDSSKKEKDPIVLHCGQGFKDMFDQMLKEETSNFINTTKWYTKK